MKKTGQNINDLNFDVSMISMMKISDQEFNLIRELVYQRIGITLGENKRNLVVGRLQKIVKKGEFRGFKDYYNAVSQDKKGLLLEELANAISTNHTFFWRENDHFEFFQNTVLPEILKRNSERRDFKLRLWCPGCSSGEEPYTLAFLIREALQDEIKHWDVGVLATDVSTKVLNTAVKARYPVEGVDKLPKKYRSRYFRKNNDVYEVCDEVKRMVLFKKLNLLTETYPFKGRFHIVFCRNVMIYFDDVTRKSVVSKFANYTHEGGYLFIGHSETLGRNNNYYSYVKPAVYRKT